MRRIIIGVLLGATATTPLQAQDGRGWGSDPDRTEARAERAVARRQRHEQQEVRQDHGERHDDRPNRGEAPPAAGRDDEARREAAERDRGRTGQDRDRAASQRDQAERARDRMTVANAPGPAERGRDWRQDRRDDPRDLRDERRDDRHDWRGDDRRGPPGGWDHGDRDRGGWTRDWRQDRRYDWQSYRQGNRSLYRAPRYYAPRGYAESYRRWAPGYRLQPYFYDRSYWIDDPWRFRLPPAYGPYRWVRYYDDVLLIDLRTGLIADAIYGFFW